VKADEDIIQVNSYLSENNLKQKLKILKKGLISEKNLLP